MSLSRHDRAALARALGWLLATSALVGLALAASCGLGCAAVRRHVTVQDGRHPKGLRRTGGRGRQVSRERAEQLLHDPEEWRR